MSTAKREDSQDYFVGAPFTTRLTTTAKPLPEKSARASGYRMVDPRKRFKAGEPRMYEFETATGEVVTKCLSPNEMVRTWYRIERERAGIADAKEARWRKAHKKAEAERAAVEKAAKENRRSWDLLHAKERGEVGTSGGGGVSEAVYVKPKPVVKTAKQTTRRKGRLVGTTNHGNLDGFLVKKA